jgi:hypothetical protein
MGMDVFGRRPNDVIGEYFRANIWSWYPLHDLITRLCGDLFSKDELDGMACNDGVGPYSQVTCDQMIDRFLEGGQLWKSGHELSAASPQVADVGLWPGVDCTVRGPDGTVRSLCFISARHVEHWLAFLRHCGGFAVF